MCPDELWEDRDEKLGALSEIRSKLYKFIFRPFEKFRGDNPLRAVADALAGVEGVNLCVQLALCSDLLVAFSLAFNSDSDSVAPRRLAMLDDPERRTRWRIGNIAPQDGSSVVLSVCLEYEARLRRGTTHAAVKSLSLRDLEEFQSSLVLVQSTLVEPREIQLVEDFLRQFMLAQQVLNLLNQLVMSGHFDFQRSDIVREFPLKGSQTSLEVEAAALHDKLSTWEADVEHSRQQYYWLNCLTLKQLWAVMALLDTGHGDAADASHAVAGTAIGRANTLDAFQDISSLGTDGRTKLLDEYFSIILIKHGLNVGKILAEGLPWPADVVSAGDRLDRCGAWLTKHFRPVPLRTRQLSQQYPLPQGALRLRPGINLIACQRNEHMFEHLITRYALAGWLPEREEVLLCTETTTWESISNALFRWELAGANGRVERIYTVAGLSLLSFSLQSKVCHLASAIAQRCFSALLLTLIFWVSHFLV